MSKLILSFEGTMLKTVDLNKERITIGRRPDNDIQVDNHALFFLLRPAIQPLGPCSVLWTHQRESEWLLWIRSK